MLSYSVQSFKKELDDPRLPLKLILEITKHVLKGLEYLHDECNVIHSGMFDALFTVVIGRSDHLTDLGPGNILISSSELDDVVMNELSLQPATVYGFPKTIPPNELPFHPVLSAPLIFGLEKGQGPRPHWVIADLGHGVLALY